MPQSQITKSEISDYKRRLGLGDNATFDEMLAAAEAELANVLRQEQYEDLDRQKAFYDNKRRREGLTKLIDASQKGGKEGRDAQRRLNRIQGGSSSETGY